MGKAHTARSPAAAPASACAVVDLARQLLVLWDGDNGSQSEFSRLGDKIHESEKDQTMYLFRDWRNAVEELVSFTAAKGINGALVQLALSLDTLDDLTANLTPEDQKKVELIELRINRLISSAIRAIRETTEIDPTVASIVEIYGLDASRPWIDRVKGWAEKHRAERKREGRE